MLGQPDPLAIAGVLRSDGASAKYPAVDPHCPALRIILPQDSDRACHYAPFTGQCAHLADHIDERSLQHIEEIEAFCGATRIPNVLSLRWT